MSEPLRTLTNAELVAVAALWKRSGREFVTQFTGSSMLPSIASGADVRLVCSDDVRIGDVVAYVYGDRVIVHRIVANWRGRFVTRGDANLLPDPVLLERSDIIGKVADVPPASRSFFKSAILAGFAAVARVSGPRSAMRMLGVLRRVKREARGSPAFPQTR